jgi:hypothetical protein
MRIIESMAQTLRFVVVFLAIFVAVESVSPHGLRPFNSRPQNGVKICTGAEMKARNGFSYFQHVRTCKIQGGKCCQPTDAGKIFICFTPEKMNKISRQ